MTRYLVPLDGSSLSEKALPWAKLLAGHERDLHLMRVIDPRSSGSSTGTTASKQYLDRLVEEHGLERVRCSVTEGNAAEAILAESQKGDVEAIVMCSHGEGGVGKWLVGSVTSKVLKAGRAPVFVVRGALDAQASLENMIVGLDGSELAERGLDWAVRLGERFGARIKLVQVLDHQRYSTAELKRLMDDSSHYLKERASNFPHLRMEACVRSAGILEGLLKESSGYDLTILTSHGQGGFQRWLLGSLTEKVLHQGKNTLLVVPAAAP